MGKFFRAFFCFPIVVFVGSCARVCGPNKWDNARDNCAAKISIKTKCDDVRLKRKVGLWGFVFSACGKEIYAYWYNAHENNTKCKLTFPEK